MARLQVVALPGDRFGLVLDEVSADMAKRWITDEQSPVDVGAVFVLCFQDRCDVIPNNFDKDEH